MQELTYICDNSRHLICLPYSIENLHRMASDLGLAKNWYHKGSHPHYDMPKKRVAEITNMCKVVSSKELLLIIKNEVQDNRKETGLSYIERDRILNYSLKHSLVSKVHYRGSKIHRASIKQRP